MSIDDFCRWEDPDVLKDTREARLEIDEATRRTQAEALSATQRRYVDEHAVLDERHLRASVAEVFGVGTTADAIRAEVAEIEAILVAKNRKYGDSAINPVRVFSKASPIEQLNVRLDDKLSRLIRGDEETEDEDVELDLIGYLVLRRVARRLGA